MSGVRTPFEVLNADGSAVDPSDVSVPPLSPTATTLPATTTEHGPDHHRLTDIAAEHLLIRGLSAGAWASTRVSRRASDHGSIAGAVAMNSLNGTGTATSSWS